VPALYLAFALYAWVDFTRTAHDGLANLGLMLVTLPVTVVGLLLTWALGRTGFVLIPSGPGYYTAHAIYFWPAALLTAALLYGVCSALDWLLRRVLRAA
jgi:ABC-type molybdate transport system permease subunit